MSPSRGIIPRPKRWDVPFSDDMTDADVERILAAPPFKDIDQSKFRGASNLGGILKNDARLLSCQEGDIIVREGDWGNSAFFILSGAVRVELMAANEFLPDEALGRRAPKRKSLFHAIAQLWSNHKEPEFRDLSRAALDDRIGSRGSGQATRIFLQDVPRILDEYKTVRMDKPGELFGEIAALGRIPRTATVFAEGEAELVEIRWQGLRDIMRKDRAIKNHIEKTFRENALKGILRAATLFTHVTETEMQQLVDHAVFETFGTYDSAKPFRELAREGTESGLQNEPLVAKEDDHCNGITLVCSGLARLSRRHHNGHRTLGYLTPGQIFGFEEIAEAWETAKPVPLQTSLRALGYLTTVFVPTRLVEEFVLEKRQPPNRIRQSVRDGGSMSGRGLGGDSGLIEFAMENSFVQGTATMVINLDRCTRCDDCVRACAVAHDNNPRFIRHGPIHNHLMFANACMHCVDPVCMIECPTGAIHREPLGGQVVINDRTCIGCTACAKNCPYDAIRMVDIRDRTGNLTRDDKGKPIQQATKCDLCVEQLGGPACQRACPHDALVRVNMTDRPALENVVNR